MSDAKSLPEEPSTGPDLFAAAKRRRNVRILIGLVSLMVVVAVGFGIDRAFFRFDRMIAEVQDCSFDPQGRPMSERCTTALGVLVAELPERCPRVLAAIRRESKADRQNPLLYALLKARAKRFGERTLAPRDKCLEQAITAVYEGHRKHGKPGTQLTPLPGVSSYTARLLESFRESATRIRLLQSLATPDLDKASDLISGIDILLASKRPQERQAAIRLVREHLHPALTRLYRAGVAGGMARAKAGSKDPGSPFSGSLDLLIAEHVGPGSPLGREILDTYFNRLHIGPLQWSRVARWHHNLFQNTFSYKLSASTRWPARLLARAEVARKRDHERFIQFLALLANYRALKSNVEKWFNVYADWAARAGTFFDGSLRALLRSHANDAPTQANLIRLLDLLELRNLPDRGVAALARTKRGAGELGRLLIAAALAHPISMAERSIDDWLPRKQKRRLAWVLRYLNIPMERYGSPVRHQQPKSWPAWARQGRDPAILAAFDTDPARLGQNLKHPDATHRFLALLAARKLPFAARLALLGPSLSAHEASVRAVAVYVLGLDVGRSAFQKQLHRMLRERHRDPSPVVRLTAFHHLARAGNVKLLQPFVADTSTLMEDAWERLLVRWPTSRLVAWLDRKDHGAGLVMAELGQRAKGTPPRWRPKDVTRLNDLVRSGDDWTRLRVLRNLFFNPLFSRVDWTPLFTAKWVIVRRAALRALRYDDNAKAGRKYRALVQRLTKDPNVRVQKAAARILKKMR